MHLSVYTRARGRFLLSPRRRCLEVSEPVAPRIFIYIANDAFSIVVVLSLSRSRCLPRLLVMSIPTFAESYKREEQREEIQRAVWINFFILAAQAHARACVCVFFLLRVRIFSLHIINFPPSLLHFVTDK